MKTENIQLVAMMRDSQMSMQGLAVGTILVYNLIIGFFEALHEGDIIEVLISSL